MPQIEVVEKGFRFFLRQIAQEKDVVVDGEAEAFAGIFVPDDLDGVFGAALKAGGDGPDVVFEPHQRHGGEKVFAVPAGRDAVDGDGCPQRSGAPHFNGQAVGRLAAVAVIEDSAMKRMMNLQHEELLLWFG